MQQRFLVLDGLRGVLALFVVAYHVISYPYRTGTYLYLAVDFFFLLSGFVLAHAYEDRMQEPGAVSGFIRERIIRLHPLLLIGALPGGISMLIGPHPRNLHPWLTGIFGAIPFPALWLQPLPRMPFPVNTPSWSLFWEIVINIAYALLIPWLTTRRLIVATALGCVALTIGSHYFTMMAAGDYLAAGLRVACFPLGVLLWRFQRAGLSPDWLRKLGPWSMPLMLVALLAPDLGFSDIRLFLTRFVLFPAVVLAAPLYQVRFPRFCHFAGEISYPLYILHMPATALVSILCAATIGPVSDPWCAIVALPLIVAIWRWYDEPVRLWLRKRWGWRRQRPAAPVTA